MMARGLSPTMVYPRDCSASKSVVFPAPGPPVMTIRRHAEVRCPVRT
jgi:hypothetical protein